MLHFSGNRDQLLSEKNSISVKRNNESHSVDNNESQFKKHTPKAQKMASTLLPPSSRNSTTSKQSKSAKITSKGDRSSFNSSRRKQIEHNGVFPSFKDLERNKTIHYYRTMKQRLADVRKTYLLKKQKPSFTQLFSIFNKNPNTSLIERNDLKLGKDDNDDNNDDDYSDEDYNNKGRIDNKALIPAEPRTGIVLGTAIAIIEAGVIMVTVIGFGGLLSIGVLLFIKILIKLLLLAMVGIYLL